MIAPTSDERREVVERLREQVRYMRVNNCYEEDLNVVDCGNSAYRNIAWSVEPCGNFERGNYVPIVERLADLIDPTCTSVLAKDKCSVCGEPLGSHANYCPKCGARAVDDG